MTTRRDFVKLAATAAMFGGARSLAQPAPRAEGATAPAENGRDYWTSVATRLANPVLGALAARKLKATMPVEDKSRTKRSSVTHLEALGRLLAGISPWLELVGGGDAEAAERSRLAALAREAIDAATDPKSPDFLNFSGKGQPLVDSAFLAQAVLRARSALWDKLPERVRSNLVAALASSRVTQPMESNWVLFASMVEAALLRAGAPVDEARLKHGIERHQQWYVGDGTYGDGAEYHWDYYNSFVIQPMLLEVLDAAADRDPEWTAFHPKVKTRLTRYAAVQERLVAPDGTYPAIGRSLAYRCGAFQVLALASLRHMLPKDVKPGQARAALASVIKRTMEAPGTFDAAGWLQIGVCGHQPSLGETYISTGSLYLCSVALLPLGLPASDPFWSAPTEPTTNQKVWSGVDIPTDHALGRH